MDAIQRNPAARERDLPAVNSNLLAVCAMAPGLAVSAMCWRVSSGGSVVGKTYAAAFAVLALWTGSKLRCYQGAFDYDDREITASYESYTVFRVSKLSLAVLAAGLILTLGASYFDTIAEGDPIAAMAVASSFMSLYLGYYWLLYVLKHEDRITISPDSSLRAVALATRDTMFSAELHLEAFGQYFRQQLKTHKGFTDQDFEEVSDRTIVDLLSAHTPDKHWNIIAGLRDLFSRTDYCNHGEAYKLLPPPDSQEPLQEFAFDHRLYTSAGGLNAEEARAVMLLRYEVCNLPEDRTVDQPRATSPERAAAMLCHLINDSKLPWNVPLRPLGEWIQRIGDRSFVALGLRHLESLEAPTPEQLAVLCWANSSSSTVDHQRVTALINQLPDVKSIGEVMHSHGRGGAVIYGPTEDALLARVHKLTVLGCQSGLLNGLGPVLDHVEVVSNLKTLAAVRGVSSAVRKHVEPYWNLWRHCLLRASKRPGHPEVSQHGLLYAFRYMEPLSIRRLMEFHLLSVYEENDYRPGRGDPDRFRKAAEIILHRQLPGDSQFQDSDGSWRASAIGFRSRRLLAEAASRFLCPAEALSRIGALLPKLSGSEPSYLLQLLLRALKSDADFDELRRLSQRRITTDAGPTRPAVVLAKAYVHEPDAEKRRKFWDRFDLTAFLEQSSDDDTADYRDLILAVYERERKRPARE